MEVEDEVSKAAMDFDALCDKQREAVLGFLRGQDIFVSLPSGGGKRLCYSILPKVFDTSQKYCNRNKLFNCPYEGPDPFSGDQRNQVYLCNKGSRERQ